MRVALGSLPSKRGKENEDFAAAAPGAAVLLDGAGVAGAETGCVHGVAWFSGTLGAFLLRRITAHPARSLVDCLAHSIDEVRSLHGDNCDLAYRASPTSTVVAVRVGDGVLEYLVLGDSSLLLAQRDGGSAVVTDRRLDKVGKQLRGRMDELPTGSPEHAAALAEYRDALTGLRNRPDGFWIAGPEPRAAEHALTGTVPLDSLTSVTLLSDGATRLVDRFQLADWAGVVSLLNASGPNELIRRVREAEAGDPDGRRWPRGKTQDDATVLHWSLL
ncbi:protein phosphatase 2C domain-containing protein [Streptomyces sp. TRM70350]|uniref:protein phosphatase 2C domain-containing protein n=1 Tax=Streptomyces sp. TRM70350 TaxID=2856165 RepID=UPI001C455CE0|nr:protein phosphatase 2C domain-containing protein [Streptomyces sp. TRM70350]MBV7700891.1 protein phosphatase 2C domain-containing protein [Streptomyces sp. TRM70350]